MVKCSRRSTRVRYEVRARKREWGERAIKWPFKRSTVPLTADVHYLYRILVFCSHFYNFSTRSGGINKIKRVYSGNGETIQPWERELVE